MTNKTPFDMDDLGRPLAMTVLSYTRKPMNCVGRFFSQNLFAKTGSGAARPGKSTRTDSSPGRDCEGVWSRRPKWDLSPLR